MTVVDASAMVELLLQTPLGSRVEARLLGEPGLHAPHLLDVEVLQALRRLARGGEVSDSRAEEAIADLADFGVLRHPHDLFLRRAWELRGNLTAYDAMYVALAEALAAPLLTCDAPLGAAPGHSASIEVIR